MDRTTFDRLFDMTGRTAIVTGGTRGIGLAMAEGFILAGANVESTLLTTANNYASDVGGIVDEER